MLDVFRAWQTSGYIGLTAWEMAMEHKNLALAKLLDESNDRLFRMAGEFQEGEDAVPWNRYMDRDYYYGSGTSLASEKEPATEADFVQLLGFCAKDGVEITYAYGVTPVNVDPEDEESPISLGGSTVLMQLARYHDWPKAVEAFLAKCGETCRAEILDAVEPVSKMTALHYAADGKHYKTEALLLEAGAKADIKDSNGRTVAALKQERGAKLFEAAGAAGTEKDFYTVLDECADGASEVRGFYSVSSPA